MVNIFVGQRAVSTAGSGNFDFTSADDSATPVASIHAVTGATANDSFRNDALIGLGFSDGTNEYTSTTSDNDNQSVADSDSGRIASACAAMAAGSQFTQGQHNHNSFIPGGQRLTSTNGFEQLFLCNSMYFDDCNVAVLEATLSTSVDTAANIDPGFAWDAVILSNTGVASSFAANSDISIGFFTAADDNQACLIYNSDSGSTATDVGAILSTNYGAGNLTNASATIDYGVDVSVGTGTSCDLTTRVNGGNGDTVRCLFLGFTGSEEAEIIQWPTPTSTGNNSVSGVSFEPQGLIHIITYLPSVNTGQTDSQAGSWGLCFETADSQYSFAYSTEYASGGNSNAQSLTSASSLRVPLDTGSQSTTTSLYATHVSLDSNGWTHNWTNRDSTTARQCITLAIGETTVTSTGLNFNQGLFIS